MSMELPEARKRLVALVTNFMEKNELDGVRIEAERKWDTSFDGEDETTYSYIEAGFNQIEQKGHFATEGKNWRDEKIAQLTSELEEAKKMLEQERQARTSFEMGVVAQNVLRKYLVNSYLEESRKKEFTIRFDLEEGVAIMEGLKQVVPALAAPYQQKAVKLMNRMMELEPEQAFA